MSAKKTFLIKLSFDAFLSLDNEEESIKSLNQITKAHTEVIQAIYDNLSELKLKDGEVFIETLSIKILTTTKSISELSKGFSIETESKRSQYEYLDFSSINIMTRAIIESFLTLEYLFYNDLTDEEKYFRFLIWRLSGYKSRKDFFEERDKELITAEIWEKLESESHEIDKLFNQIKESRFFNNLKKQHLWKLDQYGIPRLDSWNTLLKNSMLENNLFILPYKLYSNYAHSEYISLIQLNEPNVLNKSSEGNKLYLRSALMIVNMINCVSIIELKNKFSCCLNAFGNLDETTKEKITFWSDFAKGRFNQY